jgi:hypothetical protein
MNTRKGRWRRRVAARWRRWIVDRDDPSSVLAGSMLSIPFSMTIRGCPTLHVANANSPIVSSQKPSESRLAVFIERGARDCHVPTVPPRRITPRLVIVMRRHRCLRNSMGYSCYICTSTPKKRKKERKTPPAPTGGKTECVCFSHLYMPDL